MSKDAAEKYYYSISFNQTAAPAPTAGTASQPTHIDGPEMTATDRRDDTMREKVVSKLFSQKTIELNQLVASLEAKLAEAESERQTLKMQTDLVYGLLSEIQSLRAMTSIKLSEDDLLKPSAGQDRPRPEAQGRTNKMKIWLAVACLMVVTAAATALVTEHTPLLKHLQINVQ